MFILKIEKPKLNSYSKRQYNADVYCECCGRGIANRHTATVAITNYNNETGEYGFVKITDHQKKVDQGIEPIGLGYDPVGFGTFIGSHCAKRLPKEYKVSMKKCMKEWAKTDYQNT